MQVRNALAALRHPSLVLDWWRNKDERRKNARIVRLHVKHAEVVNAGERILGLEDDQNAHTHQQRYQLAAQLTEGMTSVLDFACGTGYGSTQLAQAHPKAWVTGYDHNPDAIGFGREHYKEPNLFLTTDRPSGRFQAVIGFEYLEHTDDIQRALDELISFTERRLVASFPYHELQGKNPHHQHAGLDERSLRFPVIPSFRYQHPDGTINMTAQDVQNLIFILDLNG